MTSFVTARYRRCRVVTRDLNAQLLKEKFSRNYPQIDTYYYYNATSLFSN
jgi:hypothetical protein